MNRRTAHLVSAITFVALLLAAVPAFAVDVAGPVPNDCTVGGAQLKGLDPDAARALIRSNTPLPNLAPLTFTAALKTFTFPTSNAVAVDVEAMLARAYGATDPTGFVLQPVYAVNSQVISDWVAKTAPASYKKPVNAKYVPRNKKLVVKASKVGQRLDRAAARALVGASVAAAINTGASSTEPQALPCVVIAPKITKSKLGEAIHVDRSDRRIRLYDKGKTVKKYRCAVGLKGFSTPTGTFEVTAKRKNPTWGNPGSAWARNMPRFIGPGPSNPLGTRALNLSASGIRIHGTSKRYSIGHAASHGCVRMLREDVEDLYKRVPKGTPVFIVK